MISIVNCKKPYLYYRCYTIISIEITCDMQINALTCESILWYIYFYLFIRRKYLWKIHLYNPVIIIFQLFVYIIKYIVIFYIEFDRLIKNFNWILWWVNCFIVVHRSTKKFFFFYIFLFIKNVFMNVSKVRRIVELNYLIVF